MKSFPARAIELTRKNVAEVAEKTIEETIH